MNLNPCHEFITGYSWWVTSNRTVTASSGFCRPGLRAAVLIGSILRMPYPWEELDNIFVERQSLQWRMFITTNDMGMSQHCLEKICSLSHLQAISWVDLSPASMKAEDEFVPQTSNGSLHESSGWSRGSLRQFFKLSHSYRLMQEFEVSCGCRFDIVLKTRSDVLLTPPLDLNRFPHLLSPMRVVYAVSDLVFLANREVTELLLGNLLSRLHMLAGTDLSWLPISYEQLLISDLEDVDFFLMNFPCFPADAPQSFLTLLHHGSVTAGRRAGRRVPRLTTASFKRLLRLHWNYFNSIDHQENVSFVCTGARWPNSSFFYQDLKDQPFGVGSFAPRPDASGSIDTAKAWFYLLNQIVPPISAKRWPGSGALANADVFLHPLRHYSYCEGTTDAIHVYLPSR